MEESSKASKSTLETVPNKPIAILNKDGTILDFHTKELTAYVQLSGKVVDTCGNLWVTSFNNEGLGLWITPIRSDIDSAVVDAPTDLTEWGWIGMQMFGETVKSYRDPDEKAYMTRTRICLWISIFFKSFSGST